MTRVNLQLFAALLLTLWLVPQTRAGQAPEQPLVRIIDFAGNEVTRPSTMLRELLIQVGDPADPGRIERSRQAVQDLGLFKSVEVAITPVEGGVRLLFTVHEKWRVLPLPKIDGNSNGDYGYGGQLRWNNLWGLNQTLNLQAMEHSYQEPGRSADRSFQAGYNAPFIGASRFGVSGSASIADQDSFDSQGRAYREAIQSAQLLGTYSLSAEHPSKGWSLAGGVGWLRDSPSGDAAPGPTSYGTGPIISTTFDNLKYRIYSEDGDRFRGTAQWTVDGVASTYTQSSLFLAYRRDLHVGTTPHQSLEWLSSVGLYRGGAPGRQHDFFALGGSRSLRGYPSDAQQGDAGYSLSLAYLRPVGRDWCRALLILETGSAYTNIGHIGGRPQLLSLGLGLRIRVTWLINTEIELGAALPLINRHGIRPFAGSGSPGP